MPELSPPPTTPRRADGSTVRRHGRVADHPALAAQFDVAANGGIRPEQVSAGTNELLWWACPVAEDHRWRATGANRLLRRSGCPACDGKRPSVTNNLARYPQLAAQFDVAANRGLTPEQVVAGTNKPLWWACPVADDHRWQAPGRDRVGKNTGCPACAGRQPSVTNNLARYPELAAQFDVAANGGLTPEQVVAGTNKPLWWRCPEGLDHRWRASGSSRVLKSSGCAVCARLPVSRISYLAAEFDAAANGGISAEQSLAGARLKLWWRCPAAGHRWRTSGSSRMRGESCPECAGRPPTVPNNLAGYPELAAQFDVPANGGRTPEQVAAATTSLLWWACPVADDHRWRASGNNRTYKRSGCPACEGYQPSITNNLARYPELVAQFDVAANDGLTPDRVVATTGTPLWWTCPVADDHRWRARGRDRVRSHERTPGSGCPMCENLQPSVTNNLVRYPEVAAQLDVAANDGLTPDRVVATTGTTLWWTCCEGPDHRWQATGRSRVRGLRCPMCAGRTVSVTNSLARYPVLAAQFDVAANDGRTPKQVVARTSSKLWWSCPRNPAHRWRASGRTRQLGFGCPHCVLVATSAREVRLAAELAAVLDLDVTDHRIALPGARAMRVDVLCPRRRIVVEYDGAYFHRGAAGLKRDRAKTSQLTAAGYTVIRIREEPLPPAGSHCVVLPGNAPIPEVAARVLESLTGVRPDVLTAAAAAEYRKAGRAIAELAAERRLTELYAAHAARQAELARSRGQRAPQVG